MGFPISQLITQATNARNAYSGGQQVGREDALKQALLKQQMERKSQEDALKDALMKAQTAKLLQPPTVQPRNIDPRSPEGIAADVEAERQKLALKPQEPKQAKAPVLGTPEYLKAQEELETMRQGHRPKKEAGTQGAMTTSNALTLQSHFNGTQVVKDAEQIATAMRKIRASAQDPSSAGDMALLIGYMKLLDPNSVVRETEFATAAKSGSLPQQIQGAAQKVVNGQRLTPEQRADFVARAEAVSRSQRDQFKGVHKRYSDQATAAGLNPASVVYDPYEGLFDEAPPAAGGGRAGSRGALPPLSNDDRAKAKTNPAFAAWLKQRGYTVP